MAKASGGAWRGDYVAGKYSPVMRLIKKVPGGWMARSGNRKGFVSGKQVRNMDRISKEEGRRANRRFRR